VRPLPLRVGARCRHTMTSGATRLAKIAMLPAKPAEHGRHAKPFAVTSTDNCHLTTITRRSPARVLLMPKDTRWTAHANEPSGNSSRRYLKAVLLMWSGT
jgi:hypothetical protein